MYHSGIVHNNPSIQCLECTSLNSEILDQLGKDSINSIRSAQRIGYSSRSGWSSSQKCRKFLKQNQHISYNFTAQHVSRYQHFLSSFSIVNLFPFPFFVAFCCFFCVSIISPPLRIPRAGQNLCMSKPDQHSADVAASLQISWSPLPLVSEHRRRRPRAVPVHDIGDGMDGVVSTTWPF